MTGKRYDDKLHINMPFAELVERFARVPPSEIAANIKRAKKKKPPRAKTKRAAPGGKKATNVLSFRERKTQLRNKGRA
jgi:hypothetical protein